jgi:hypothetical protein
MTAKLAAARRTSFEIYTSGLIEGSRSVDPSILKWFLEEEQRHAPPQKPIDVSIEWVQTLRTKCPQCGHMGTAGPLDPKPEPPAPPRLLPAPGPENRPPPDTMVESAAPSSPQEAAKIVTDIKASITELQAKLREAERLEHELTQRATAQPLHVDQSAWRNHIAPNLNGSSPFNVRGEPHPYVGRSGHQLPDFKP